MGTDDMGSLAATTAALSGVTAAIDDGWGEAYRSGMSDPTDTPSPSGSPRQVDPDTAKALTTIQTSHVWIKGLGLTMLGIFATGFIGLIGVGFGMNGEVGSLGAKVDNLDGRLVRVEERLDRIDSRLSQIEALLARIDERTAMIDVPDLGRTGWVQLPEADLEKVQELIDASGADSPPLWTNDPTVIDLWNAGKP